MGTAIAVARNAMVRSGLALPLRAAARWVGFDLRRRIAGYARQQARLRARLGLDPQTPIQVWGEATQGAVEAWARTQRGVRWAETSGSTNRPKRLPFTRARLRRIKRGSWETAVQAGRAHGVTRPTLFVLAALERDASLSSLMLETPARTPLLDALVMPSKLLWEPRWAPLLDRYGPTACRLYLLALSDPGFVYSTNPSTLAVFLSRLAAEWDASRQLIVDVLRGGGVDMPVAREAIGRVSAPGWAVRLERLAAAAALPDLGEALPGLRCFACWDGGYVGPFLERIRAFLPAPRFVHVPMFSMATETVQTTTWYDPAGRPHFLPLAPGVLYEFLPVDAADDDLAALRTAPELEVGGRYCLVVSDVYGLRRYQTCDVFRCEERVHGLPDLRFERRRGLAWSFTGEKLTGEQASAVFARLREEHPALAGSGAQLTLVPSQPEGGALPHYRLVVAAPGQAAGAVPAGLEARCDALLGEANSEWTGKRRSARLGPTRAVALDYDTLAHHLGGGGDAAQRGWETQFKLLPLYTRTWEALGLPALAEGVEVTP